MAEVRAAGKLANCGGDQRSEHRVASGPGAPPTLAEQGSERSTSCRMRVRWRLGQVLAKIERGAGPGRGKKNDHAGQSFMALLKRLGLPNTDAVRAQRIGALPESELEKALAAAHAQGDGHFASYAYLLDRALR